MKLTPLSELGGGWVFKRPTVSNTIMMDFFWPNSRALLPDALPVGPELESGKMNYSLAVWTPSGQNV